MTQPRSQMVLAVTCLAAAAGAAVFWSPVQDVDLERRLPAAATGGGYATSGACQACHPDQYETWHRSYHRTMTQVATPTTALAPFDGSVLEDRGFAWRFERRGEELWAVMPDPAWFEQPAWLMQLLDERWPDRPPTIEARVVMSTGSHHMQTYWIRRPGGVGALAPDDGSLVQVPWVWLIEEGRWVPNQDSFLTPPTGSVGGVGRWNANCSQCHSVGTEPRTGQSRERFDTRTVELGIACEACHGAAERHVAHYRAPWRRYARYLQLARSEGDPPDATIVNPAKLVQHRSTEVCGQCHSFGEWRDQRVYLLRGSDFGPGEELDAHRRILDRTDDLRAAAEAEPIDGAPIERRFWADGTSRVAGREYNALRVSTHYSESDLTCLSCHSLHEYASSDTQLLPGADGDAACLGCHEAFAASVGEHTRHSAGSAGSECMNCHMPRTTYGLFTAMRSHRIDSPDLGASLESGRPNACNLCHLDRTLAWTGAYLEEWYGKPIPVLGGDERTVAAGALWALRGDAGLRAIAAWHMGWGDAREASGSAWMPPYLSQLLMDPYAAARLVAYRALRSLPGFGDFAYDYVASGAVRGALADEAARLWLASGGAPGADPALLLGADGRPDTDAWLRLLAERDLTPVTIRE